MSVSLLSTKLTAPRPRAHAKYVPRSRLLARLDEGLQRSLTLISAPAGCGKTSLLGEWSARNEGRVAWLSLDEADNDPVRFWTYLTAALQTLHADLGEGALALLRTQGQPSQGIESFLTMLLNEIVALDADIALVLDDYHVITTATIHRGVTFLLDHLPPQMHIFIASRADPALPLARLRANGPWDEIRADDLRFTLDETATFLNQAMGLRLSADNVAALEARTEGWIVGLQLAALSMRGRADVAEFIAAFAGSHRYIVDYLTEETLQRQPEAVQSFLLQTAILDRLCGALCEAVTGQAGGQAMLAYLEQANLFTIGLDDERRWYRYHHLFAEMLRNRLRREQPEHVVDLHRKASEWYEHNRFVDEAVGHALAGEDFEHAARLVEQHASAVFWVRGEIGTLLVWLEALPEERVRARPRLGLFHAWALLLSGQLAAVEPHLEDVERGLSSASQPDVQRFQGEAAAIRSRLARMRNDLPGAIELSLRALELLPVGDVFLRGVITLNLGIAYWQSGNLTLAMQTLAEASMIRESAGSSLVALGILSDLRAEQGHLHHAADGYREAMARAAELGRQAPPTVAWSYAGMGELRRQWNNLDAADDDTFKSLELARLWGNPDGMAWAWLHIGRMKEARGDAAGAQKAVREAVQVLRQYEVAPWTAAEVEGYQCRLWIARGNIADAERWVQERRLRMEDELAYVRRPEYVALARLLLAQGKWEAAVALLERLLRQAEDMALTGSVIETLILQALAHAGGGETTRAMNALWQALAQAEPEGYIRLFVDEGEAMQRLLSRVEAAPVAGAANLRHYVAKLLGAFPGGIHSTGSSNSPLPDEALSERELVILPLLAEGLSNREIAARLFLSPGTVKVHLKHIYGKLAVNSRTQAVARARQLNLL